MSIALIVHGGAGLTDPTRIESAQSGCKQAVLQGWRILQAAGSALDAVEAAVCSLEDNPAFNAGTGSCLTAEGHIEMDAGLMEGHTLNVGAVASVELIKNPILLARKVLESPHVLLSGRGAQEFAIRQGMTRCKFEDLLTERQYTKWQQVKETGDQPMTQKHGTVGAVALDSAGHLVAASSTGGIVNKVVGRVGDAPLVGCGFYADTHAAVACTGYGEDFIRLLIAKRAADFVAQGASAHEAAEAAIAFLGKHAMGTGGLIVVDHMGNTGFARNSQYMSYSYIDDALLKPVTGV